MSWEKKQCLKNWFCRACKGIVQQRRHKITSCEKKQCLKNWFCRHSRTISFLLFYSKGFKEGRLYDTTSSCVCTDDCSCLTILVLPGVVTAIASYLLWFERKQSYEQVSILLAWMNYHIILPKSKQHYFCVPFDGDCIDDSKLLCGVQEHYLCKNGLQLIMDINSTRWFCPFIVWQDIHQ